MANQSVLELAVGTGKWDAGLKKAVQSLNNFTQANGGLSQTLNAESQKMQKFVSMMGSMESSAKTAKGQMNDYKAAIEQLTMQFNRMTSAQKESFGSSYTATIEQLKAKYQSVNKELQEMTRNLNDMPTVSGGGGGLFAGLGGKMSGALQVFAGNMMTKAAGAVAQLGSEMADMVKQGVEMARQGEGIRIAFERLGRGDILQGLREATHGTVTDLELMKAAVKFNDFKLPVEELGTMLAFAQQKAKDTGQSVDYMVDSIVTGLGRKSLMILDNLGLSATEIRERMKETGDMTKAVGSIIREQMAKAGDYVETAADRAAQANVSLQNKMEELGRKFAPVEEASNQLWTSMKIAILDVVGGPLATMLNQLTEAGRLKNVLEGVSGGGNGKQTHNERALGMLRHYSGNKQELYNRQVARYDKLEEQAWREANSLSKRLKSLESKQEDELSDSIAAQISEIRRQLEKARNTAKSWQIISAEYQKGAAAILNPSANTTPFTGGVTTPKGGGKTPPSADEVIPAGSVEAATKKVQDLQKAWRLAADDDSREKINKQIEQAQLMLDVLTGKVNADTLKIDIVDDNALNRLSEIEGWHFDPKTLEIVVESREAWNQLKELEGITFSPKSLPMLSPQELAPGGIEGGVRSQATGTTPAFDFSKALGDTKATITAEALAVDQESFNTLLRTTVENGISSMDGQFAMIGEKLAQGLNIPDSAWEAFVAELNAKREELDLPPISLNIETGKLKELEDGGESTAKAWKTAAGTISGVAGALNQIPDPAVKIAATIGMALANVAGAYAETLSKDKASKSNIWTFIAATAAAMVSMVSTIATIKSNSKFANGGLYEGGGFVPGNRYSGDLVPANGGTVALNSGELILTRAQQGVIADALGETSLGGLQLSAVVRGEDIKLALNNNSRRRRRGEYVTSREVR